MDGVVGGRGEEGGKEWGGEVGFGEEWGMRGGGWEVGEGTTPEGRLLRILQSYCISHKATEHDLSIIYVMHIRRFTTH